MSKIAIIGVSCLFPGAETPEAYWSNLVAKKDTRVAADAEQMGRNPDDYFAPEKGVEDKYYCTLGGYIQNFKFDPEGYAVAADHLSRLDNTSQWSLHVSREALKDAGYLDRPEALKRCGVLIGNLSFPTKASNQLFMPLYHSAMTEPVQSVLKDSSFHMHSDSALGEGDLANGSIASYPATVISQALNCQGGSFALDAACATSLYSMKLACSYLLSGKTDLMLAGAVSAADPWFVAMGFSTFNAFPENIASQPLDQNSTGLNTGEGAGVFVLKRYEDAVADGDNIHAVIDGVGLSNDGKGKFVLSPSEKGQVKSFERAYQSAGVKPDEIDYVECHATGTPLGDAVEVQSMADFFGDKDIHFTMGSAKSNFGHLLTAAGMAGLLKIILGIKNELLPATIGINNPLVSEQNKIAGKNILTENQIWKKTKKPRHAAISAFGFGGTNAHLVLQEHISGKKSVSKKTAKKNKSIAKLSPVDIVGMGAFFGGCSSLSDLENSLYNGEQHFTDLPEKRWHGIEQQSELLKSFDLKNGTAPQGNYIDQFDFDYLHFKIPPEEQAPLIPQQLLMIKVLDDSLKDADLPTGGNVGVIVAMETDLSIHQFRGRIDAPNALDAGLKEHAAKLPAEQQEKLADLLKDSLHNAVEINQFTSFIGNIIPCRICSLWDFSGPAFTMSSEENSVMKALEVAQLFLDSGEVDAMVVGAVDLAGGLEHVYLQNKKSPLNATPGLSLQAEHDGWTVGEGAGAVVLMRSDKRQDSNKVYASLAGMGSSHAVSVDSMQNACDSALKQANIDADKVDYIELNSSGFKSQDDAELAALKQVYSKGALGSVKANIGHTFAASGMAALIKTALCLHHRFIPGIPNWHSPTNIEDWQDKKFYFPTESRPWLKNKNQRYAAINSLGQDESCHHLILTEVENASKNKITSNHFLENPSAFLMLLAGNDQGEIEQQLTQLEQQNKQGDSLKQLAQNLLAAYQSNSSAKYCLTLVAHSMEELSREILSAKTGLTESFASGEEWNTPMGSYFTPDPQADKGDIAFVYPGGFNSYIGMAKDIFHIFPELHQEVIGTTSELSHMMRTGYVYPQTISAPDKKAMKALEHTMGEDAIAMFESGIMTSIVYTKLIQNLLGVKPKAAFGHSMGELSMLFSSGAWKDTDYMSHTLHSTATFQHRLVGEMSVVREAWNMPAVADGGEEEIWGTYTLRTSPEIAEPVIAEEDHVFLIIVNAPNEIVIAGEPDACKRVVKKLKWRLFPVPIKDVVHNELVNAEYDALRDLHSMPTKKIKGVSFYTAANYKKTKMEKDVIANNIATFYTQQVDFPQLVNQVYKDGAKIFIELGPQSSCTKWIGESLKDNAHLAVGIDRKGVANLTSLLRMAAKLTSHRVPMKLEKLFPLVAAEKDNKAALVKSVVLGKGSMADTILASASQIQVSQKPASIKPEAKQPKNIKIENKPNVSKPMAPPKVVTPVGHLIPTKENRIVSASTDLSSKQTAIAASSNTSLSSSMGNQQGLLVQLFQHNTRISEMHADFLNSRHRNMQQLMEVLNNEIHSPGNMQFISPVSSVPAATEIPQQFFPTQYSQPEKIVYSEEDLKEFAYGKIGKVFGPEYDVIDSYGKRVMLPMDPYLLVTRVTEMEAVRGEYKPSKMTTEYDIPHNSWYSTDGQIPVCICIESGQCDLLLISYMGIDFENKGKYLYRLLDCTLTFLDDQPKEGQTLRYEISINSFARNQNNLLFFFSYECFIGDKMILKMDNGCAGFFCEDDLAKGKGVIRTKDEIKARAAVQKNTFAPILQCAKTAFDKNDMHHLAHGDLAACFENPAYDKQGKNPSLHFPLDKILMLDRITSVERTGGLWGLGQITAEIDLVPDEWYFTSHFRDDPVLAGSLMSEGCVQLMHFYMMYLGLHTKMEDARFQTKKDIPQVIRCRGEGLPKHRLMTYQLEITEIGLTPKPFVRGNAEIWLEGKMVVDFRDICIELSEKTEEEKTMIAAAKAGRSIHAPVAPVAAAVQPVVTTQASNMMPPAPGPAVVKKPALFDELKIEHFATGDIEACFGPEFAIYKKPANPPRRPPRTPNSYLQLMHRVLEVGGARHDFDNTTSCVAEYDVAENEWFCAVNSYPSLTPYSMLMEIALQPNGFLTSQIGTTLIYPETNLFFRNLDGEATLYKEVDLRGKTITNKSTMYATSAVMNNVIQKFTFELLADGETFYKGTAVFGFFAAESLVNQVGMDKGKKLLPWYKEEENVGAQVETIDLTSADAKASLYTAHDGKPFYRLAGGMLDFIDESKVVSNGGQFGKGYVHSQKTIDKNDWFYPCHFHLDPVMPGSLGVEAMIQSLQVYALRHGLGKDFNNPRFGLVEGNANWQYRGQIIPDNKEMTLEVHIKEIKVQAGRIDILADGNLWKDGLRIYHVENIGLSVQESV
jgi:PfaB family protein